MHQKLATSKVVTKSTSLTKITASEWSQQSQHHRGGVLQQNVYNRGDITQHKNHLKNGHRKEENFFFSRRTWTSRTWSSSGISFLFLAVASTSPQKRALRQPLANIYIILAAALAAALAPALASVIACPYYHHHEYP